MGPEGDTAVGGDNGMEEDGDMIKLSPVNLHPILRYTGEGVRNFRPPLTIALFNVRPINNKTSTLWVFVTAQNVDLKCD